MPRRSGGRMRSSSPSRVSASRPTHTVVPPSQTPVGRQPGLFGQMAATAGGIAVGSAIGHTIGDALTGPHGHDQPVVTSSNNDSAERYTTDRCNLYQKEFLRCLDMTNGDSKSCQGFWEALKDCQRHQNSATV